ncbi:type II toxin-antitoxin system RnlA family toxin [Endozoicomonas gorgoniicola]|uniref:Type II toxin-antitoxin system RnlA family toxin n=1 Tax=Endozoicomonas gorgoniicola TaxID=1234144 RepID=A0ABT3MWJ0_9GAMM|nr:type II toxin-antitoxin system RnlA family toxin [Endozoicomonas gorgoniicola]MCW7553742.1 type II toxin-antitoxin system RnlA family toxin [Endozoicomonas gorgoniicola]
MSNYKSLNLKRESIDVYVEDFVNSQSLNLRSNESLDNNKKKRITIGRIGVYDAIVDLHLNKDGTTTVNHKLGKNQELGAKLAQFLLDTIDPNEFLSVNYTLKGIHSDNIEPIIEEIGCCSLDGSKSEFEIAIEQDNNIRKIYKITSVQHQDTLTVTHFKTTKLLSIQGKPLFSYRRLIYLLSELLDLAGLQTVLSRTEENTAQIIRSELAKDYLKGQLPDSFENLPQIIKDLLVSGCCVKLASPDLPEYSMLLFPDLRALEGVLRTELGVYGMHPGEEKFGFGAFFSVNCDTVTLKSNFKEIVDSADMVLALEKTYEFFRKLRHTLFHMEDFAEASRKIDTLDKAIKLSKDCYNLINNIYRLKNT